MELEMCRETETGLRDETRRYWAARYRSDFDRLLAYVDSGLLFAELEYGRRRGAISNVSACDVLVLPVGFSLEPLLQSVCVYKPAQILLVLSETYPTSDGELVGSDWGRTLEALISCIKEKSSEVPKDKGQLVRGIGGLDTTRDNPGAVFQYLLRRALPLQRERKRIVVDITGAKKSMVAGAYLFAAYAGVPVSYVDFDRYDQAVGRPLGYTCRIGLLANPYESFAIREWQDVERLYRRYAFGAALERLETIRSAMSESLDGFFDDTQRAAVDRLVETVAIYDLWESGDLHAAVEQCDVHSVDEFHPPDAVVHLGRRWPDPRADAPRQMHNELLEQFKELELGPGGDLTKSLYLLVESLRCYAHDEAARIKRIIDLRNDYRSGLLRAAALNETLIKARLVRLWHDGQLVTGGRARASFPREEQRCVDGGLVTFPNLRTMVHVLTGKNKRMTVDAKTTAGKYEPIELARVEEARKLQKFWKTDGTERLNPVELSDLRHKAIHSSLTVRKPLADEALRVAEANLSDFEEYWVGSPTGTPVLASIRTTAVEWPELCRLCGIEFLPHGPDSSVTEGM
jgi:hypothetical protein